MMITLIGCVVVLLFLAIGYRRGVLRILSFIVALLLTGLVTLPLARVLAPLFDGWHLIPRSLAPLAALIAGGFIIFLIISMIFGWLLTRREQGRNAQGLPVTGTWERYGGAVLGALWGGGLYALVLTGLHLLGTVEAVLDETTGATYSGPVESTRKESTLR